MRYLDPIALARLKNFRLYLGRHLVEGHMSGRHRSARRGFSQEFAEHRAYVPGDELKRIDWKAYARKDRVYIKEFQEEKSLKTYLLVDASGSMGFRVSGLESKWEVACRLAMSLAYLALSASDAVGLITFDAEPRDVLLPSQSFPHLQRMDRLLEAARPGGETDLGQVLRQVVGRIPRRSRVVLLSDLLGDCRNVLETIKAFHARKHQILILQLLDPMERNLDWEGPTILEGLEKNEKLFCEPALLRKAYQEAFERQQRLYQASFRGSGIAYQVFYTDSPWHRALTQVLTLHGAH